MSISQYEYSAFTWKYPENYLSSGLKLSMGFLSNTLRYLLAPFDLATMGSRLPCPDPNGLGSWRLDPTTTCVPSRPRLCRLVQTEGLIVILILCALGHANKYQCVWFYNVMLQNNHGQDKSFPIKRTGGLFLTCEIIKSLCVVVCRWINYAVCWANASYNFYPASKRVSGVGTVGF